MKLYVHYGEKELGFSLRQGWDVISAENRPPISGVADPIKEIRDALDHPIGSPRIEVLGEPLDENYLTNLGISVLKTEKKFNRAAGFTGKDDRLPKFFSEEKLPPSGNVFDVPEEEIDSVYKSIERNPPMGGEC